jgi:hypothetical protein
MQRRHRSKRLFALRLRLTLTFLLVGIAGWERLKQPASQNP